MSLRRLAGLALVLLAPSAAFAQEQSDSSKVEAMKFPALPKAARVQGEVRLRSGPDGIVVVSGDSLLAPSALENLKQLGMVSGRESEAVYHFVIVDTSETRVTRTVVKRGNRFTRLFFRAFRMETERVVEYTVCIEHPPPKNRIDSDRDSIDVWVYASAGCIQI